MKDQSTINKHAKPFLRWTGSKKWLVKKELSNYIPKEFNNYHECFLGSGAVFFSLNTPKHSYLSDTNKELIDTYIQLRENVNEVIAELRKFRNTEEDYYNIRSEKFRKPSKKAAKFIYLNRCSFNGIYRVNVRGEYNVPYGRRKNVDILTEDNLINVSKSLKNTSLNSKDFSSTIGNIKEGDLVFLDPPYTVAHENNGFIEYNQKLFSWDDQITLRDFCLELNNKGAFFILTNAYHNSLLDLYKDFPYKQKISRSSIVGGRNKTRGLYNELLIYNTVKRF